jgi:hypothetical protein
MILELFSLEKILGLKGIMYKDRGKATVRLGRRIGKNGSSHWVGAGRRDEMKNKTIIYI